jgi:glycosyltransferase involved in cell wall biosynthesis
MKILLVHNAYKDAGGEDVVVEQEHRLLESSGHEVVAYHRSNWETETNSIVERLHWAGRAIWSGQARGEILNLLYEFCPDLVHVHNTFVVISPSVYSACKQAGVPVVQTLHNYRLLCPAANCFRSGHVCEECLRQGVWHGVLHACYRDSCSATAVAASMLTFHRTRGTWSREVDCYIALTRFARGKFIQAGIPAEKIRVKPNFLDPDPGMRAGCEDWGICVGRLSTEKGADTVLAAWKLLPKNIELRVIGEGPSWQSMASTAEESGLSIHFEGRLDHGETIQTMKKARFLVFPSLLYENFPMTILEAFACGVPLIASGTPSVQEIVQDGRTGLLFRPGDAADLAEKIVWAWDHPTEMNRRAESARAEFCAKYTAPRNYQVLMDIYQEASSHAGHLAVA